MDVQYYVNKCEKAALLAVAARYNLSGQGQIVLGSETYVGGLQANDIKGVWGGNIYSKHLYFNTDKEGVNMDGGWWGPNKSRINYSHSQAKSKAKWVRSGKAARKAANRLF